MQINTLRGLNFAVDKNFAVFAVFDKNREIKSTRNTLKWSQPRNLIHAKFNFWTAFFHVSWRVYMKIVYPPLTLFTLLLLTKKIEYLLNLMLLEVGLLPFLAAFCLCRYCPRLFLTLYSWLPSSQRKVD